ncbi:hypothetical protein GDO86_001276 [Hymenochirus boettgeri]|uniref:Uncharacterized protein n=1 Tax=Hymenochirus boettgeri TaxID=247094 RepID=A0A8T2KF40_9PIPI|nr:hypothetical protein GDO86_001276 [Hymenochirus boettgeri]
MTFRILKPTVLKKQVMDSAVSFRKPLLFFNTQMNKECKSSLIYLPKKYKLKFVQPFVLNIHSVNCSKSSLCTIPQHRGLTEGLNQTSFDMEETNIQTPVTKLKTSFMDNVCGSQLDWLTMCDYFLKEGIP